MPHNKFLVTVGGHRLGESRNKFEAESLVYWETRLALALDIHGSGLVSIDTSLHSCLQKKDERQLLDSNRAQSFPAPTCTPLQTLQQSWGRLCTIEFVCSQGYGVLLIRTAKT